MFIRRRVANFFQYKLKFIIFLSDIYHDVLLYYLIFHSYYSTRIKYIYIYNGPLCGWTLCET